MAPVVNYSTKMFGTPIAGAKSGKIVKQLGVEEEILIQLGLWRDRYYDLISRHDDDMLILAGKIVNQRGLKSKKYSFEKKSPLECMRIVLIFFLNSSIFFHTGLEYFKILEDI